MFCWERCGERKRCGEQRRGGRRCCGWRGGGAGGAPGAALDSAAARAALAAGGCGPVPRRERLYTEVAPASGAHGHLEQLVASERAVFVEGGLERSFRGLEVDHREQRLRILGRERLGVVGPFGQLHRSSTGTVVTD